MTDDAIWADRITELEVDNRRLRRLLDQLDAPSELRHRSRNTSAMLRTIVRKSADTKRDLDLYVAHVEDRLDALMRAQALADAQGGVGLHRLVADELLHYGASEGERVFLSGPEVNLQPRAGQVFALAIHELAVNAVEHGVLGTDVGTVEIAWTVSGEEADKMFTFAWSELDTKATAQFPHRGFGTEVLTRTLRHELDAETTSGLDSQAFRCTIKFPLTERIGRVA